MAYTSHDPSSAVSFRAVLARVGGVFKRASDRLIESRHQQAAAIVRQVQEDMARSSRAQSSLDRASLSREAERYRYYF